MTTIKPTELPWRPTLEEMRALAPAGKKRGLLSVRPDAKAVNHPKLYVAPGKRTVAAQP